MKGILIKGAFSGLRSRFGRSSVVEVCVVTMPVVFHCVDDIVIKARTRPT